MFKLILEDGSIMPKSLFMIGIKPETDFEAIGVGHGIVSLGQHEGKRVMLRVVDKVHGNVSPSTL
jgi:hypothetical protein